jgi:hypothetical protein
VLERFVPTRNFERRRPNDQMSSDNDQMSSDTSNSRRKGKEAANRKGREKER